jgi:aldehyde:ferredoxin oxidoreductase
VVNLGDGQKRKGPEYETVVGFGPNLLIDDLNEVVRLGEMCDKYGMDSISTANTIGLAFHLFEMGKITLQDTGGLVLHWGDFLAVRQLIRMIAAAKGSGGDGRGSPGIRSRFWRRRRGGASQRLGTAYHDPRGVSGMALSYATSPRGACHNQSDYFFVDWGHTMKILVFNFLSGMRRQRKLPMWRSIRIIALITTRC